MPPEAHISHRTAERLRLRIPGRKGDAGYFSSLADRLSRFQGVERIEANAITGSILVLHRMDVAAFVEHAEQSGLFVLKGANSRPEPLYRTVMQPLTDLDRGMKKFTGGEIDLPSIAFVGLLGVGIYQISIGNFIAPAWYTAFWYAFNTVFKAEDRARD